ncbi:putative aldouronate transport system permease protein [Metabacillus crassostreae]|uniref:ABC transporter permease n=1 Tax=Metabacillus crassostreae TaxID=929098 RepID=UPI0019580AA8|nr:ABC transporter permease subunit [Metabacillus crassostreae]MBM7604193.1 putative aldouronate transport system permease protein [Metabacillus crassostreae]
MDTKVSTDKELQIVNVSKKEKFKRNLRKLSQQKYLQVMALLGVIWMFIFNYIPMYGLIIAFKEYSIIKTIAEAPWVGFMQFREFFEDENFWLVLKNTLGISLIKLFIGFPLPIIFALLLNELTSLKFKKMVQTISYLPHFLSWVVLGGILTTWLADIGIINEILLGLGVISEKTNFLADPQYFWGIVILSDIWKELGWSAIIYLAAIAGVSTELYEAATIDGANRFQKMWNVTLPSIRPTIAILFILAVSGVLNSNFDQILILRNALNESASNVIDIYVYQVGIQNARYSYATAVGLLKAVIAFILLLSANKIVKKLNGNSLF